jgi:hypothetical protein
MKLNEHYRFHPNAAFKRIDRLRTGKINNYDISSFLRDNNHNVYSVDVADLLKTFD